MTIPIMTTTMMIPTNPIRGLRVQVRARVTPTTTITEVGDREADSEAETGILQRETVAFYR